MTIDLDALEKLAESLGTLDSEERDWPLVKIHGRMFHVENAAKAASDGLTALIAELKEARGLMSDLIDANYAPSSWSVGENLVREVYGTGKRSAALISARTFLARNGKGEG